jgi:uncharacterized protein
MVRVLPAEGTSVGAIFVFAHGAGAGHDHPFMVEYARALAGQGVDVATFNFPYMQAGRRAPDRASVLEAAFTDAVAAARGHVGASHAVFIGGKSMGGRMASHLAAQGVEGLRGVVALGYPLHPPGKPEQLRVAHLASIAVPVLIVQGEKDTFGTPAELGPHLATMRQPTLHVVSGGDHSLTVRGTPAQQTRETVVHVIVDWMRAHR